MKTGLAVALVLAWLLAAPAASAHRLDETLQATTISVEKDRVFMRLCLTPGVAVSGRVLAALDTDGNGVFSDAEQQAYSGRVLQDLSLAVDGSVLRLRLVSSAFPEAAQMQAGLGDILLGLEADLPPGSFKRRLVFENHYQNKTSVYLVNCLFPNDPGIRVTGQQRNAEQSFYQLDYTQADARARPLAFAHPKLGGRGWLPSAVLALSTLFALLRWWRIAVARANSTPRQIAG